MCIRDSLEDNIMPAVQKGWQLMGLIEGCLLYTSRVEELEEELNQAEKRYKAAPETVKMCIRDRSCGSTVRAAWLRMWTWQLK